MPSFFRLLANTCSTCHTFLRNRGIRRYDLNGEATVENVTYATFVGMWIAHDGTIVSLETLEGLTLSPNLQDDLLLTAASDGCAAADCMRPC